MFNVNERKLWLIIFVIYFLSLITAVSYDNQRLSEVRTLFVRSYLSKITHVILNESIPAFIDKPSTHYSSRKNMD